MKRSMRFRVAARTASLGPVGTDCMIAGKCSLIRTEGLNAGQRAVEVTFPMLVMCLHPR
jgi:hypothetical protein